MEVKVIKDTKKGYNPIPKIGNVKRDSDTMFNHLKTYFDSVKISQAYQRKFKKYETKQGYYIYRLVYDTEVVYVGRTHRPLYTRISDHKMSKKIFNRVEYLEFKNGTDYAMAEIYFINKYNCKYNKQDKYEEPSELFAGILDNMTWILAEDDTELPHSYTAFEKWYLRKQWNKYYSDLELPSYLK